MTFPFDIFRKDSEGVLWLEESDTLESAEARVQGLAALSRGEYFIFSHKTGDKLVIKPAGVRGAPEAAASCTV